MHISTKAKVELLKRTAPRPIQWLMGQVVREAESTEAHLQKRIKELEHEVWYWKDKYQDEILNPPDDR